MKKFTLFALAAAFAITVSAQRVVQPQTSLQKAFAENTTEAKPVDMQRLAKAGKPLTAKKVNPFNNPAKNLMTRADEGSEIITEAPEGRLETYSLSGIAYYSFWGYVMGVSHVGTLGQIVYGDDNSVYFKNPFSQFATNSYLKGTLDGDQITVTLPQPIYQEDYYGEIYNYQAERLVYVEDEDGGWYYRDESSSEIKFTLRNDSVFWAEDTTGNVMLGLCDDTGEWMGYGDYNMVYGKVTDQVVEAPADLATEEWVLSANGDGFFVNVGFSGSDVYVGGLYQNMPDAWIKGTVEGDKVVFPSGQYLGPDESMNCHTYFVTSGSDLVYDEDYQDLVTEMYMTDKIELSYDAAAKTMIADSKNDSTMLINSGKERVYYILCFDAPQFKYQAPIEGATKPQTPEFYSFSPYDEAYGFGYMDIIIPKFDVEGRLLDTNKMHYNIFIDDELFTFYPDEYVALTEEITDVPYNFDDGYDIYDYGTEKYIYFYTTGFEKIGVRSTYTADNGESADSDIAWYYVNGEPTGINAATATGKNVKSVVYTDLSGRRTTQPVKGLYIKTEVYDDGTQKSVKVINRR